MSSDSLSSNGSSTGEEPTTDRSTAHVGLVCTHALELQSLIHRLDRRRRYSDGRMRFTGGFLGTTIRVAIVEAGTGFSAHRRATEALVNEHAPSWIISAGFSSSLADEVRAGDLSLATEICDMHGQRMKLNCPIPESKHATLRTHLVADRHPATPVEKRQLASEHSAFAADTVSLAVAQICETSAIPCLSIRAVIDGPDEEVPQSVVEALFEPVSAQPRNPVSRWANGLLQPKDLKRWISRAATAAGHLDRFLSGVIRQLGGHLDRD